MTRPAPLPLDRTPDEPLLAAIANPWRRALVAYCATSRTQRDIFREFVCAGKEQRYGALRELTAAGWLRDSGGIISRNRATAYALLYRLEAAIGIDPNPWQDEGACDASVAALRRSSCLRVWVLLQDGPKLHRDLRDELGLTNLETQLACTTLLGTCAVREPSKGLFERVLPGFPALQSWLEEVSR